MKIRTKDELFAELVEEHRERYDKLSLKTVLTQEQMDQLMKAAEILAINKRECEPFKGRDGI